MYKRQAQENIYSKTLTYALFQLWEVKHLEQQEPIPLFFFLKNLMRDVYKRQVFPKQGKMEQVTAGCSSKMVVKIGVVNDFPEMWLTESLSSCIILYKKWVLLLSTTI